jgi:hypothetical protein
MRGFAKALTFLLLCLVAGQYLVAQDDLLKLVHDSTAKKEYVTGGFKSTRVINGHSMEMLGKGVMDVRILHRFYGPVSSGIGNFFGFDFGAQMRIGFDYGISKDVMIGIGRSTLDKEYEALIKWRPVQQASGPHGSPVSILLVGDITINTDPAESFTINGQRGPKIQKFDGQPVSYDFSSRSSYYMGLIIGRKFSNKFSFQITPEVVLNSNYLLHPNTDTVFVQGAQIANSTIFAVGFGARYKVSKRIALVVDYHHAFSNFPADNINHTDPLSVGIDIETGGHVFQLHFSNTMGMNERAFLTGTTDKFDWDHARFGFNLSRVFTIKRKKDK